jgi:hypothetical protein
VGTAGGGESAGTTSIGSGATNGAATGGTSDNGGNSADGGRSGGASGAAPAGANAGGAAGTGGASGVGGASGAGGGENQPLPKRFLLYHFSTAEIDTVPAQLMFFTSTLQSWGYEVEDSVDPADISAANLARFGGVGMINTCFEPFGKGSLGETQTPALEAFVENGGGLFGTHCASVTFQDAEPPNPYNDVIGGRGGHGFFEGPSACRTTEQHATTTQLPPTFEFYGNLDNADYLAPDTKVLVRCKWSGGDMKDTAISWYRTPGKGRVFYTNFAKLVNDLNETLGSEHITAGLGWVLGR